MLDSCSDMFFLLNRRGKSCARARGPNGFSGEAEGTYRAEYCGDSCLEPWAPEANRKSKSPLGEQVPASFQVSEPSMEADFDIRAYPDKDRVFIYLTDLFKKKRLDEATQRANDRLRRLHDVSQMLGQALTRWEVGRVIIDQSVPAVGAQSGSVGLLEADGAHFSLLHATGRTDESLENWRHVPLDMPTALGEAMRTGRPVILDAQTVAAFRTEWAPGYLVGLPENQAWISLPLLVHDQVIGSITLGFNTPQQFPEDDLRFLLAIAGHCAQALERARLYDAERQARSKLEAANQVRSQMLAYLSHDLKGPLTLIKAHAQLLVRKASSTDAGSLRESAHTVEAEVNRLNRMLDELVDATHLELSQSPERQLEETDLVALARAVAAEHQQAADDRQIEIVADPAELIGLWDASGLRRVIDNLLSNAIKYSPDGGTISVEIMRETAEEGTWAALLVTDSGVGIAAEALGHIFEPFYRAPSVSKGISGRGIGLASVRQIVQQHGGTVSARSAPGCGTTLEIRLPLATEPS